MLTEFSLERFIDIQCQLLDRKINTLKEYTNPLASEISRDFKYKCIQLEQNKNKFVRKYKSLKDAGEKGYEELNAELKELCDNYNNLFIQLNSSH